MKAMAAKRPAKKPKCPNIGFFVLHSKPGYYPEGIERSFFYEDALKEVARLAELHGDGSVYLLMQVCLNWQADGSVNADWLPDALDRGGWRGLEAYRAQSETATVGLLHCAAEKELLWLLEDRPEIEALLDDPHLTERRTCHDWRNHVPKAIWEGWDRMAIDARLAIYLMAERAAQAEDWD